MRNKKQMGKVISNPLHHQSVQLSGRQHSSKVMKASQTKSSNKFGQKTPSEMDVAQWMDGMGLDDQVM